MDADQTVSTHAYVGPPGSDTTPFVFGSTVGRFVIRERLGTGGMGEVYRAEDTQLKRTVAIKRLLARDGDHTADSRLLKEAQRASALNHPRIASVYDVFTIGNQLLLVMEFVDGVTLRERMRRKITITEFCDIAVQCTEALSAAHSNGILHRDLKPANIMLTADGHVKVCDFGLALRLPRGEGATETITTQQGIAGTPAYLAPEAILERPLDERADIFSLGVVFYQMLAVRNPFDADSLMATLDRLLHESPEPLERVNPHVPARLARTIHRMLEKNPRDRYANAAEVGRALTSIATRYAAAQRRRTLIRRLRIAAALLVAAVLTIFAAPRVVKLAQAMWREPLPASINLVVLPFTVTGTAGEADTLAAGLTESLTEQLSKLTLDRRFQLVTEADRRARGVTTPLQASQQFSANLALRGSLQYSTGGVAVETALIDIGMGRTLRTQTIPIDTADPISVELRVVEAATRMLNIRLTEQEARRRIGTTNPQARGFYLKGRAYLLDEGAESVDLAIAAFNKAFESDKNYALAYAGLGQAFWRKQGKPRVAAMVLSARSNCDLALRLNDALAEGHICLGTVLNGTGEYESAAYEFDRAVELDRTNDVAYTGLASALENLNRHTAAKQAYRDAIAVRPHYWRGYYTLGSYYYRWNHFKEALEQFQHAVRLAPDSFRAHNTVGAAHFSLGHTQQAIDAFSRSREIERNYNAASNLGTLYYFEGKFERAAEYMREAVALEDKRYDIWSNLAHVYDRLGRKAQADEAFRQARDRVLQDLRVNPRDAALYVELADHHAALGEPESARRALSDAVQLDPQDAQTQFRIAVLYETRMNARDQAFAWLTRAVQRGQSWYEIERAPELRDLRTDRRFAELRKAHGSP